MFAAAHSARPVVDKAILDMKKKVGQLGISE
jgi:hypothetical protein